MHLVRCQTYIFDWFLLDSLSLGEIAVRMTQHGGWVFFKETCGIRLFIDGWTNRK